MYNQTYNSAAQHIKPVKPNCLENHFQSNVYLSGDTHGRFDRIISFCNEQNVTSMDTLIILGDAGLNYWGDWRDKKNKARLSKIPINFFCIHGNHEMRPSEALGYEQSEYHGGKVWAQPEYPNILFAIDGEIYNFNGNSCIVIGGAYSVDKYYRLTNGLKWFPDEQPSDEIKNRVQAKLDSVDWKVDVVLSHTCPFKYTPTETFLSFVDQSTVDNSTEHWLDDIEDKLDYGKWYCGHWHIDKPIEKIRFVMDDFVCPNQYE